VAIISGLSGSGIYPTSPKGHNAMCRLLGIYGRVANWREIAVGFSIQTETGNLPPGRQDDPGHKDGWGLIHNGTIYQAHSLPRDPQRVFTSQDSDTEHLFHYLLTKIKQRPADKTLTAAMAATVSSLGLDYTALNLMLSDGRDLYVLRNFKTDADYYTRYYYQLADGIILCSEPIDSKELNRTDWSLLANNLLLRIHGSPAQIEDVKL
jgi:predicted glutamine amidotransferase